MEGFVAGKVVFGTHQCITARLYKYHLQQGTPSQYPQATLFQLQSQHQHIPIQLLHVFHAYQPANFMLYIV